MKIKSHGSKSDQFPIEFHQIRPSSFGSIEYTSFMIDRETDGQHKIYVSPSGELNSSTKVLRLEPPKFMAYSLQPVWVGLLINMENTN